MELLQTNEAKILQKHNYTKEQEEQLLTECLLESGFTQYPEELRRAEGESVVFLNGYVQHYVDYQVMSECHRSLTLGAQGLILTASGAISQSIFSNLK